jgi:hypothetical protein
VQDPAVVRTILAHIGRVLVPVVAVVLSGIAVFRVKGRSAMKRMVMIGLSLGALFAIVSAPGPAHATCPYDPACLSNPYGAGSPYQADGLMNSYSQYGSANKSWANPYATDPPKLYDQWGNHRGRLSTNPHLGDSIANPYGQYGNPYSLVALDASSGPAGGAAARGIREKVLWMGLHSSAWRTIDKLVRVPDSDGFELRAGARVGVCGRGEFVCGLRS